MFLEIEITEESEVCRKREDVILGDHALTFKFETEEQAKSFRKFIDFRFEFFCCFLAFTMVILGLEVDVCSMSGQKYHPRSNIFNFMDIYHSSKT